MEKEDEPRFLSKLTGLFAFYPARVDIPKTVRTERIALQCVHRHRRGRVGAIEGLIASNFCTLGRLKKLLLEEFSKAA
jgi:hypothetical protein